MTFKVSPRDTCELFSNITWKSGCPDYNRRDSSEYDLPLKRVPPTFHLAFLDLEIRGTTYVQATKVFFGSSPGGAVLNWMESGRQSEQ
jgi:hypothetical protein